MYQPVSRRSLDMYVTEQELDFSQILNLSPLTKYFSKLNMVFENKPKLSSLLFFSNEEIFVNN